MTEQGFLPPGPNETGVEWLGKVNSTSFVGEVGAPIVRGPVVAMPLILWVYFDIGEHEGVAGYTRFLSGFGRASRDQIAKVRQYLESHQATANQIGPNTPGWTTTREVLFRAYAKQPSMFTVNETPVWSGRTTPEVAQQAAGMLGIKLLDPRQSCDQLGPEYHYNPAQQSCNRCWGGQVWDEATQTCRQKAWGYALRGVPEDDGIGWQEAARRHVGR